MSLDKFVMRGFTSSVGSSSGQWVARSAESQQMQTFQPNNDGGTSFVMGGAGLSRPSYRGGYGRNVPNYRDEDYMFNCQEVMAGGTGGRREVPSGCFGGGRSSSGGMDGQKAIIFIFIIIMSIVCAFVAFSGATGSKAKAKRPHRAGNGQVEQPLQRGQPVWY